MDFQKKFILKRDDASMDKDDNQVGCLSWFLTLQTPLDYAVPDEVLTCVAAREFFPFDTLISIYLINQRFPGPVVESLWPDV